MAPKLLSPKSSEAMATMHVHCAPWHMPTRAEPMYRRKGTAEQEHQGTRARGQRFECSILEERRHSPNDGHNLHTRRGGACMPGPLTRTAPFSLPPVFCVPEMEGP